MSAQALERKRQDATRAREDLARSRKLSALRQRLAALEKQAAAAEKNAEAAAEFRRIRRQQLADRPAAWSEGLRHEAGRDRPAEP